MKRTALDTRPHRHSNSATDSAMARLGALVLATAVTLAAGACIQKETRNTIYLEPDGSFTWTIYEGDARSDATEPSKRDAEEAEYRREILSNPTPLVALLESIGGRLVSRTVLKDTAPFEVHTSARFDRIDDMFARMCAVEGCLCESRLDVDRDRTTLSLEVLGETDMPGPERGKSVDSMTDLTIVLVQGRFVAASGFILDNDRTARFNEDPKAEGPVRLSLTWTEPAR